MAFAHMISSDSIALTPVWNDVDFYDKRKEWPLSRQSPQSALDHPGVADLRDDIIESGSTSSAGEAEAFRTSALNKYGGVHTHLKLTSDEPDLKAVQYTLISDGYKP